MDWNLFSFSFGFEDKDVNRTDRTVPFYSGENNANVATLRDVLMTYMMYDFDLGYVQVPTFPLGNNEYLISFSNFFFERE